MNYAELFAQLDRPLPAVAAPPVSSPWYTRAMLGFAGWIAGLFLVGFFAGSFALFMNSAGAMLVLGAILCAGAVAIDRVAREGDVVPQLALAVGMAGRAFLVFGLAQIIGEAQYQVAAWLVMGLEVAFFVALKSPLHRLAAVLIGASALYVALHKFRLEGLAGAGIAVALAVLCLRDRIGPLGWGLALAMVSWPIPAYFLRDMPDAYRVLETAGYAAGLVTLAWLLLREAPLRRRAMALGAVVLLAVAAHRAPGVVAGVLVLIAGFASGRHAMAGLGVIGVVGYLSVFYYQMDQTLLAKSASLAAAGVVLLAGRWLVRWEAGGGRP